MEQLLIKISARLRCLPYLAGFIRSGFLLTVESITTLTSLSVFILNGVSSLAHISLSYRAVLMNFFF